MPIQALFIKHSLILAFKSHHVVPDFTGKIHFFLPFNQFKPVESGVENMFFLKRKEPVLVLLNIPKLFLESYHLLHLCTLNIYYYIDLLPHSTPCELPSLKEKRSIPINKVPH